MTKRAKEVRSRTEWLRSCDKGDSWCLEVPEVIVTVCCSIDILCYWFSKNDCGELNVFVNELWYSSSYGISSRYNRTIEGLSVVRLLPDVSLVSCRAAIWMSFFFIMKWSSPLSQLRFHWMIFNGQGVGVVRRWEWLLDMACLGSGLLLWKWGRVRCKDVVSDEVSRSDVHLRSTHILQGSQIDKLRRAMIPDS